MTGSSLKDCFQKTFQALLCGHQVSMLTLNLQLKVEVDATESGLACLQLHGL